MSGTRLRPARVAVGVVLGSLVLGAGLFIHNLLTWHPRVVNAGTAVVVVDGWHLRARSHNDLGYFGTLILVGGKCLGYATPGSTDMYVAIWPRHTTVLRAGRDVEVRIGGHDFRVGDSIGFGVEGEVDAHSITLPKVCQNVSARILYGVDMQPLPPASSAH